MTPEQRLLEIRKELAVNERLGRLITEAAQDFAYTAMRKNYTTNEAAAIIRFTGIADGAEQFAAAITKPPTASRTSDKT